jgi:hypothetical protein
VVVRANVAGVKDGHASAHAERDILEDPPRPCDPQLVVSGRERVVQLLCRLAAERLTLCTWLRETVCHAVPVTVELGARAEREHEREHVPDQPERERQPRHQCTPGSKQQPIELGLLREARRGDVVVLGRMQRRRRVQHSVRLASVLEHAF